MWDCRFPSEVSLRESLPCSASEASRAGWITTFIREVRHGGPDSGYISSGYFGGVPRAFLFWTCDTNFLEALAVGRVILLPINSYFGERNVIYIYTLITLAYVSNKMCRVTQTKPISPLGSISWCGLFPPSSETALRSVSWASSWPRCIPLR